LKITNYTCNAKALATESCDSVTEADLLQGNQVIWRYKGVPYTVEVKAVYGMLFILWGF